MKKNNVGEQMNELLKKKINYLLEKNEIEKLHQFGMEEGFLTNEIRIKIYQKLMNFNLQKKISEYKIFKKKNKKEIKEKKIKEIFTIEADVHRSFTNSNLSQKKKKIKKKILKKILIIFFLKNPQFTYYQGFNSIAEIFITNFEKNINYCLLEEFSFFLLQDFLLIKNFGKKMLLKQKKIKELIEKESKIFLEDL